jgi:hypothetical protein
MNAKPRSGFRQATKPASAAWRSAWYDERTSGPEATWREAERHAVHLEFLELLGRPVAQHRVVVRAGLQVLADGDHVDVVRAQVAQRACTCSSVSPRPSMIPDLVATSGCCALNFCSSVSDQR